MLSKEITPSNVLVGLQTLGLEPEFWAKDPCNTPTLPGSHLVEDVFLAEWFQNGRVDPKPP